MSIPEQSPLTRIPALRILVPFMIGIIASWAYTSIAIPIVLMIVGIIIYITLLSLPHTPVWKQRMRAWWIIPLSLATLSLGWINATLSNPTLIDTTMVNGSIGTARINDIVFKDFSMSLYATLTSATRNGYLTINHEQEILITTRGCDYTMQPGDCIIFKCNLIEIKGLGNPDGFNYAQYMRDQGIIYTQHIPVELLQKTRQCPTVLSRFNKYRRWLQLEVFKSQLNPEAQEFIVATLLGNSRFISPDLRSTFAAAGVSHLLALSGLHVGVIALVIWFILLPLDYLRWRKVRLIITIIFIMAYAMFTGLSASVMRASIMTIIVLMGLVTHRKTVSANTLAIAALISLIISPASLRNAGFQLSFITVTALFIFYRRHSREDFTLTRRVASIVLTSLIAIASTIILSAWYFNTISFTSIVANLFILPLFPFIMTINAAFLVTCALGIYSPLLTTCAEYSYSILNSLVNIASNLPGHMTDVYVTWIDVCIYYIAFIMVALWWHMKNNKWLLGAVATIALLIMSNATAMALTEHKGLVVFNNFSQTHILSFSNSNATLWVPDHEPDIDSFKHQNRAFIAHHRIKNISLASESNFHVMSGMRIVAVGQGKWKSMKLPTKKIPTDILIITKHFHGEINRLPLIYDAKLYILSGDIYDENLHAFEIECNKLNLNYYSIKSSGAYQQYNH